MLKLEEITKHAALTGIEPRQVVRVVTTEPMGDNALTVYDKTSDGRLLERMLLRTDAASLALARPGGRGRLMRRGQRSNWQPRPTGSRWRICSTP